MLIVNPYALKSQQSTASQLLHSLETIHKSAEDHENEPNHTQQQHKLVSSLSERLLGYGGTNDHRVAYALDLKREWMEDR